MKWWGWGSHLALVANKKLARHIGPAVRQQHLYGSVRIRARPSKDVWRNRVSERLRQQHKMHHSEGACCNRWRLQRGNVTVCWVGRCKRWPMHDTPGQWCETTLSSGFTMTVPRRMSARDRGCGMSLGGARRHHLAGGQIIGWRVHTNHLRHPCRSRGGTRSRP